jgi:hypothetical protein
MLRAYFQSQKLRDLYFVSGGDKDLYRKRIEGSSVVRPSYRISLTTHHIAIEVYIGDLHSFILEEGESKYPSCVSQENGCLL